MTQQEKTDLMNGLMICNGSLCAKYWGNKSYIPTKEEIKTTRENLFKEWEHLTQGERRIITDIINGWCFVFRCVSLIIE